MYITAVRTRRGRFTFASFEGNVHHVSLFFCKQFYVRVEQVV